MWFNRSSYFLRFHTASNSILFYTRYIFTLPRVFYIYISFHLLNVHTFVLYSYFDIFPRIVINIFPRISYTYRVLLISDFYYYFFLFPFSLFFFFFFINLHPFFHLYIQYLLHIQRSSSSSFLRKILFEFVGISSDRKYHNYRGVIKKNSLDRRRFRLRFEVARTPSPSPPVFDTIRRHLIRWKQRVKKKGYVNKPVEIFVLLAVCVSAANRNGSNGTRVLNLGER